MMNLFTCYATNNKCYKANKNGKYKASPVKGIVVHSTGANNKTLKRYVQPTKGASDYDALIKKIGLNRNGNSWNTDKDEKCVHAFIGTLADGSIGTAQILPFDFACWGCANGSKGSYNYAPTRHIQFEICEDNLKNEEYFNKAVKGEAVEFCAYLCKLFNLSVSTVVSHHEAHDKGYASNHGDIDHWLKNFGYTMKDFRKWVTAAMKAETEEEPKEEPKSETKVNPYTVRVTAYLLNIRAGAGTDHKIVGTITDKGIYTIVDEASGKGATKWGKLKSGAGWISLDYTKKEEEPKSVSYKVKVTAISLNIRSGAGTNYKIVGNIKDKGVYTIIEEANGTGATKWGKLKSGAGWISLDYVKKV